jgi:alpha-glucosidase
MDPDSHLNLYRRLLSLRRGSAALRTGSYLPVDPVPPECFVFERSQGSERVIVAINFAAAPLSIDTAGIAGRIAVSTQRVNEGNEVRGALRLLPYEAVVVV